MKLDYKLIELLVNNLNLKRKKMTPAKIFDQHRFVWVKPEATNVIKTWERFGFIRPSKNPYFLEKWKYYKS